MSEKVDSLIILDRRVDMITPLLTQLTYEGLIDELIGIKNCEYIPSFRLIYSLIDLLNRPGRIAYILGITSHSRTRQPCSPCRIPTTSHATSLFSKQREETETSTNLNHRPIAR